MTRIRTVYTLSINCLEYPIIATPCKIIDGVRIQREVSWHFSAWLVTYPTNFLCLGPLTHMMPSVVVLVNTALVTSSSRTATQRSYRWFAEMCCTCILATRLLVSQCLTVDTVLLTRSTLCVCVLVVFLLDQGHLGRRSVHLLRTRPLLPDGSGYSGKSGWPVREFPLLPAGCRRGWCSAVVRLSADTCEN